MAPEVLKKIYDPFFGINKQVGTGLGLHIVFKLMTQKLNGKISCNGEPGKDTSFTITVPLT